VTARYFPPICTGSRLRDPASRAESPARLAAWLAEALGAPATTPRGDQAGNGETRDHPVTGDPVLPPGGQPLTEAQRARWAELISQAADRQSMSSAFDLGSYDDMRAQAGGILARRSGGGIPPLAQDGMLP
jgi:hypothetical protein